MAQATEDIVDAVVGAAAAGNSANTPDDAPLLDPVWSVGPRARSARTR